jgi:branched-chain amino acid transport system ATP-binding protein
MHILATPDVVLAISGLQVRYSSIMALDGIDLTVARGQAVGLLGANGAGKTTLLNALSGFVKPSSGWIAFLGCRIDGRAPHAIVRRGLLHVSQERDLFGDLSVLDNLKLGAVTCQTEFDRNLDKVFRYFPRLEERHDQRAKTMSGGEQQMLAISRALMAAPKLLVLDEPSAGLAPLFVEEIGAMLIKLKKEEGATIILVEQNIRLAAKVIDHYCILRAGRVVATGLAGELEGSAGDIAQRYYL